VQMRFSLAAGLSIVVCVAVVALVALTAWRTTNFDFRAFYCAGKAVRQHANPYRTQPLHSCEQNQTDATFSAFSREVALPAPQPGYDIALFAVLAALPFSLASKVWTAALLICLGVLIGAVYRLAKAPVVAVLAAFWLSLGVTSVYLGELIPLCVAALCCALLAARSGRWAFAGLAAGATLVEPHVGLPVCIVLALWAPKARVTLAVSVLTLCALSVGVLGFAQNVEYVAKVLPAHALSEIGFDVQLSLSVVLHGLGLSDNVALRLGAASYIAMLVIAAYVARALAQRFSDNAFIVAVPAAFAVVGGVFMHVTEVAAAIPLVFLLQSHIVSSQRALPVALALLAVPWASLPTPVFSSVMVGAALAATAVTYVIWEYCGNSAVVAAFSGAAAFAFAFAVAQWYVLQSNAFLPDQLRVSIPAMYPEASWSWFVQRYLSTATSSAWLLRVPTWAGLTLLASLALSQCFHKSSRVVQPVPA
jgi:hypothetical protein